MDKAKKAKFEEMVKTLFNGEWNYFNLNDDGEYNWLFGIK